MATNRYEASPARAWVNALVTTGLLGAGVALAARDALEGRAEGVVYLVVWILFGAFFWYRVVFRAVHRIEVDGERVELVGVLGRRTTTLGAVRLVRRGLVGLTTIAYDGGRVYVAGRMEGLDDFARRVRAENPGVETVGV